METIAILTLGWLCGAATQRVLERKRARRPVRDILQAVDQVRDQLLRQNTPPRAFLILQGALEQVGRDLRGEDRRAALPVDWDGPNLRIKIEDTLPRS